jgi:hypothetical protein
MIRALRTESAMTATDRSSRARLERIQQRIRGLMREEPRPGWQGPIVGSGAVASNHTVRLHLVEAPIPIQAVDATQLSESLDGSFETDQQQSYSPPKNSPPRLAA